MAIPRRELRGHKCLRSGTPINSYDFPQAMHPTSQHPIGGSQQPHTAPRTNNQTDRHTRKPNPGTPATGHTAPTPRPPCDDHPTQEHATISRAPGGTTAASATQRAHHAHIPSNASPNSVTTRPSLHESHHYHHTDALPSPEDLNASKLNPTGLSGALTIYADLIFLCTERVPGQPGLARSPAPRDRDPTSYTQRHRNADTPATYPAHHPQANLPNPRTSQTNLSPLLQTPRPSTPFNPTSTQPTLIDPYPITETPLSEPSTFILSSHTPRSL